eukprot:1147675-Pelagomonas_calceolata.AAC.9
MLGAPRCALDVEQKTFKANKRQEQNAKLLTKILAVIEDPGYDCDPVCPTSMSCSSTPCASSTSVSCKTIPSLSAIQAYTLKVGHRPHQPEPASNHIASHAHVGASRWAIERRKNQACQYT